MTQIMPTGTLIKIKHQCQERLSLSHPPKCWTHDRCDDDGDAV